MKNHGWKKGFVRAALCVGAFGFGALCVELSGLEAPQNLQRALNPLLVQAPSAEPELAPEAPTIPEPDWSDGAIVTGGTPHRLIHFTFDDGPDRRTTPLLLNELDRLGIKATFFVTTGRMASLGARARTERALLQEIVRRGHRVGNHTVTHRQLPLLSPQEVRQEIQSASDLITELTGIDTPLVRPPGGSRSPRVDAALASMGYTQVLWNIGSGDFQVRSADEVVSTFDRVLARRERENGERGGIVLMHDTHPWSVAALPRIVDRLKSRNCELLAAGEELFDIVDDANLFFASRDDDPSTLAGPAEPPAAYLAARQEVLRAQTARRCAAVAQN